MGVNLTGLSKRIGDYKSKAKKLGHDVSFIPRGYSKLPQSEQLSIVNKLGRMIKGDNYTYRGVYGGAKTSTPKKVGARTNLGKYMKKTGIKDVDIASQNVRDIEYYARQLSNFKKHMLPGMKLRHAYGDIQKMIDLGYDKASNIIEKEDPKTLRKVVGLLSQAIDEKIGDTDLRNAMLRQGLTPATQEKLLKKFNKLNNVQKLGLNAQIWDRFQLKYPKYTEDYNNAPTESEKEKILEKMWMDALNDRTIYKTGGQ